MELYELNVDEGDLDRIAIGDKSFTAKKRVVHSEEMINKAIFREGSVESKHSETVLATSTERDMSSLIHGGAGTGT